MLQIASVIRKTMRKNDLRGRSFKPSTVDDARHFAIMLEVGGIVRRPRSVQLTGLTTASGLRTSPANRKELNLLSLRRPTSAFPNP